MWIDLDIFPGGLSDLKSGLARSVWLDREQHIWSAELAIPMKALTEHFDPAAVWRANFYRMDYDGGKTTSWDWARVGPSFHEFRKFGTLVFE